MKNLLSYFTMLVMMIALAANLNSCKDPCKDVTCQNGGTCDDGNCDCPDGFTGDLCQTSLDPCAAVNCENGGVCDDGSCDCPARYSGTNCQIDNCASTACVNGTIPATSQTCECICDNGYFGADCSQSAIGSYTVSETCTSGSYSYSIGITANGSNGLSISNFGDYDVTINATYSGNGNISIPSQTVTIFGSTTATFSGSGSFSGNILTINYTVTSGGASDTCTMSCTKQ